MSIECNFYWIPFFLLVCVFVCVYLNCAELVVLSRVIVHNHDKIVANVTLLVAAALVALPVRHQCGDVEDRCRDTISFKNQKEQTGSGKQITTRIIRRHFPVTHALTLHDVVMPTVGELSVVSVLVEASKEDLVGVTVLQVDEFAQACQEGSVAVGAVLV